jgi:hypothetical protein
LLLLLLQILHAVCMLLLLLLLLQPCLKLLQGVQYGLEAWARLRLLLPAGFYQLPQAIRAPRRTLQALLLQAAVCSRNKDRSLDTHAVHRLLKATQHGQEPGVCSVVCRLDIPHDVGRMYRLYTYCTVHELHKRSAVQHKVVPSLSLTSALMLARQKHIFSKLMVHPLTCSPTA